MKTPEQVVADWRSDATTLRYRGHTREADQLTQCCDEMAAALAPFLAWVSESDAMLRSGKGSTWFRSRFGGWMAQSLAEMRGRTRFYRAAVIPQRAHPSAARLAGFRGEKASA